MKKRLFLTSLLAGLALSVPAIASAHAHVTSSVPAEGATARSVKVVTLSFSEAMLPVSASVKLVMTVMPGMTGNNPMQIEDFTTAWSNGNKTLALSLKQPLTAGTYEARWQGASADDGHRTSGTLHFKVG